MSINSQQAQSLSNYLNSTIGTTLVNQTTYNLLVHEQALVNDLRPLLFAARQQRLDREEIPRK